MSDRENQTTSGFSLGALQVQAQRAIDAGEIMVTVNAQALLALCRSEQWAHQKVIEDSRHGE